MQVEGIHVLTVEGTDREMGFQHGRALREAIARGPLPAFARYVERMLVGTLGGLAHPVAKGMGLALSETVGRSIGKSFPDHAHDAIEGLADGAGLSRREIMRAVTMPETYLFLASQWIGRRGYAAAPRLAVPLFGCTSAIAWGSASTSGRMLHGRNFDYQGVGTWDREQAVIFLRPKDGQRYVSVTAAGILFGGITAMNESGLTLVVHQHLHSSDFALGGLPIGIVGDRVMRHAKTLADARRILDEHVPNGGWTYVITSAHERAVLCYEVTAKRRAVVPMKGETFGYSNVFLSETFRDCEVHAYPTHWRNVAGRYHCANERLAERTHDEASIAAILADRGTPACRFHDSIASLQTVASVVFDAERGLVWVATGRAPVSTNAFVAFDLNTESHRADLAPIAPAAIPDEERRAFESYRDAYEAGFVRGDATEARRRVEVARRLQPSQPVYHFVAGLMSLSTGELQNAERAFDRAIACGHPSPERLATFHLFRARALDLRGARVRALDDYRRALDGDAATKKAAERGMARPWKGGAVPIEWAFGEVVAP